MNNLILDHDLRVIRRSKQARGATHWTVWCVALATAIAATAAVWGLAIAAQLGGLL